MQEQPIPQIKTLREQAGLSQTELAFLVGVSVDTIANWENGRRGLDWFERFIRLCTALRCKPQDLIEYRSQTQTIVAPTASTDSEQLMQQRLDELKQKLLG